jgi:hypothetical protein
MSKKISQAQARRWKRELDEMKRTARADRSWTHGAHIRTVAVGSETKAVLEAVKDIGCALAVRLNGDHLYIYGVR